MVHGSSSFVEKRKDQVGRGAQEPLTHYCSVVGRGGPEMHDILFLMGRWVQRSTTHYCFLHRSFTVPGIFDNCAPFPKRMCGVFFHRLCGFSAFDDTLCFHTKVLGQQRATPKSLFLVLISLRLLAQQIVTHCLDHTMSRLRTV